MRASALSWQEGKMHTQQMQPHKVGDVTGFNEVATRGGAAAVELLIGCCTHDRPPGRARLRRGERAGWGSVLRSDSTLDLRDGGR